MRLRELGTARFSWSDLRAIVTRAQHDPKSALYRSLNPSDWMWADPVAYLLAEIATMESERLFVEVSRGYNDPQDVPQRYWPAHYGPDREPAADHASQAEVAVESAQNARDVAAKIRAEMAA